eukprot:GFYU01012910.1.p1 GENE.GFYU01012910.1~~GFYU01012910.1.p1  ORF type:complete len:134 (+),score=7.60 GFYU01012910.1:87-488(+)
MQKFAEALTKNASIEWLQIRSALPHSSLNPDDFELLMYAVRMNSSIRRLDIEGESYIVECTASHRTVIHSLMDCPGIGLSPDKGVWSVFQLLCALSNSNDCRCRRTLLLQCPHTPTTLTISLAVLHVHRHCSI